MPNPKSRENAVHIENGPVAKNRLLGMILADERARMIHAKVAWIMLDRYRPEKHGPKTGQASVRFLAKGTGLTHGSVLTATRDLCAWGYFAITPGDRRNPARYIPQYGVLQLQSAPALQSAPQPESASAIRPQNAGALSLPTSGAPQPPNEYYLYAGQETGHMDSASQGAAAARLAPAPRPRHVEGEITAVRVEGADLILDISGATISIHHEHADYRLQEAGRRELTSLANACGVGDIETGQEVVGHRVRLVHHGATLEEGSQPWRTFEPLAANDNADLAQASGA